MSRGRLGLEPQTGCLVLKPPCWLPLQLSGSGLSPGLLSSHQPGRASVQGPVSTLLSLPVGPAVPPPRFVLKTVTFTRRFVFTSPGNQAASPRRAPCSASRGVGSRAWSSWHIARVTFQGRDVATTAPCVLVSFAQEPHVLVAAAVCLVWSYVALPCRRPDWESFGRTSRGGPHSLGGPVTPATRAASPVAICVPGMGLVCNPAAKGHMQNRARGFSGYVH